MVLCIFFCAERVHLSRSNLHRAHSEDTPSTSSPRGRSAQISSFFSIVYQWLFLMYFLLLLFHTIFGYFLWFGTNSRTTFVAVVKHQLINKDISAALLQKVTICWTLHTQWFIMTELCWENTLGWVGTIFINIFTFKKLLLTCTNQKTKM